MINSTHPELDIVELSIPGAIAGKISRAKWIWGEPPRKINEFRLFRREFALETIPEKAELWCFAEFRYKLYVNGSFVQTGPTPCQPEHRLIDRHEVSRFLRRGMNCIAFETHCPGVMNGQWTLTNPGLLCSLWIDDKNILATDASWQTISAQAWQHPTQISGYSGDFQEWLVLHKLPRGWKEASFDASDWENAVELPFFAHGEPEKLQENYVGYPTLKKYPPANFVFAGVADGIITEEMRKAAASHYTAARNRWRRLMGQWNLRDNNEPLDDEPLPVPIAMRAKMETHEAAPRGMVRLPENKNILPLTITVPEKGHPSLVFDLETVRSGMLEIEIESTSGGTVDIARGDRLKDGVVSGPMPNVDRVEVPPGRIQWQGFFERGTRYLQIILRDFTGQVTIHKTGICETLTPIPADQPAVFDSGDGLLNKIWKASLETTRLYMNGCGAGDPVRERHHWLHDDAMALRMAFYCFGDWRTWRRGLELTAQSQMADGSLPTMSPGYNNDFNMVTSSCYWAVEIVEYFNHTGDFWFARQMLPRIDRHIQFQLRSADKDGLLYETPGRRFLSWADGEPRKPYKPGETFKKKGRKPWGDFSLPPTRGYNAIINAYWIWNLREAAGLAERLGQTKSAQRYREILNRAALAFEKRFWVPEAGLYRDNVAFERDGKASEPTYCESTLFLLMRAGLVSRDRGLKCLEKIMHPSFICCRSSGGLDFSALPVFLIEAGKTGQALEYYRDRWGEPVKAGLTTCGEEFFSSGSYCHIHGATPARDFLEYLAGIRIRAPFWSEVLLVPPADDLSLPELHAEVPAPHGRIVVDIVKAKADRKVYRYKLPEGSRGFLKTGEGIVELKEQCGEVVLSEVR